MLAAAVDGGLGVGEEPVEGVAQRLGAAAGVEQHGQDLHPEAGPVEGLELGELRIGEGWRGQPDLPAALRLGVQEVALGAEGGLGGGDQLFADGVDGRVRDLGEELLEVVVEQPRPVGEHRQGGVVAHGAGGPQGAGGHRLQVDAQVLEGEAEDLLALQDLLVAALDGLVGGRRQVVEVDEAVVQPLPVGVLGGDLVLELVVGDDPPLAGVHQEHAPRLQAALVQDLLGRHFQHADLGAHDDAVVAGDVVARRPQAVAVEGGADDGAVGEGDGGGAVPGLHQAGVKLVECPLVVRHLLVPLPGLGDHHHQRLGQGAAAEVEELEAVVEHGRVGAVLLDDRQQLGQVGAEPLGAQHRLPRLHPVDVAPQGVDLAVVDDVAVGVGALPAGEGVGGEPGVHQRDGSLHARVLQLREVEGQLVRRQHALVADRPAGDAGQVEGVTLGLGAVADLVGGALADDVELALEGHLVGEAGSAADEDLRHHRLVGLRPPAERAVLGGDLAPAEDALPLLADDLLQGLLAEPPVGGVGPRQVDHADAVGPRLGQLHPLAIEGFAEEAVGDLQQHAGAVAGIGLGPARAPVVEATEHLDGVLDDAVAAPALDVGHEADPAGIVLVPRIVQPLLGGKAEGYFNGGPLGRRPCVGGGARRARFSK